MERRDRPILAVVVPCYNEEAVFPETRKRLTGVLERLSAAGKIAPESRVYFVDDGSRDATWRLIAEAAAADPRVRGVKLSRNCGHQNALLAGLSQAEGDAIVSIDADLQDDVEAIERMVDAYMTGCDVVYGVRRQRDRDTAFKRFTARGFYRLMSLFGVDLVYDHADYRLLSRRALDALCQFREVNLFLRGMVPLVGFRSEKVYYDRAERFAGESHYPVRKMLRFAAEGITSFSTAPLIFISWMGVLVCLASVATSAWVAVVWAVGRAVPGWASIVLPLTMLGGAQILCTGVIGLYLGKVYREVKARPRYFIEETR